ncbi:uncharacterized protein LOC131928800 isoform X2 [Physella acuta]|uniref:uncharacterized protein LOC131928800 isoform X2 n=1 Tax=Physella acuta TaxID=109671 RepID=UPI0027DC412C|nr:uncharacterized protein LOC131928800 isoform X2 [Physella acuta]
MNIHRSLIALTCLLLIPVTWSRRHRRQTCVTQQRLRDKWHFIDQSKHVFIRIRAHQVVYKHGKTKVIKYRCVESQGNIYLLRRPKYKNEDDGVLCLGFSYIADHPRAEYVVLRLIGPGDGPNLLSPVISEKDTKLSIATTCDVQGSYIEHHPAYTTNAFIRRALPGCKFPLELRGRWNYTYQHAKSLEIWQRNATLHLMSGESVKFLCDKRDGGVFVFRAKEYVSKDEDAIMCAEFTPMPDDPFYKFEMSRHNSGNLLDGQLRSVSKSRPVYVHVDCDWIGSPARPEFLYP